MSERFSLSYDRIAEISLEQNVGKEYKEYFSRLADFILMTVDCLKLSQDGSLKKSSLESKKIWNKKLYCELKDKYEDSYLNPEYAVKRLGKYGQILSAIYAELISMIAYAYELDSDAMLIRMELFLEIYGLFSMEYAEDKEPKVELLIDSYRAFAFDYLGGNLLQSVKDLYLVKDNLAYEIVMTSDLNDISYLYDYGEYISENEIELASYMAGLSDDKIDKMAYTFTEGYKQGFIAGKKDLSIKESVEIRYPTGFERVVRKAVEIFDESGLKAIFRRASASFVNGRRLEKIGYFSTNPNKQFDCDHRYDSVLYFDKKFMERKLEAYHNALEKYKAEAGVFGGPAVMEAFGEEAFSPLSKKDVLKPDAETQKLLTSYNVRAVDLINKYVKGEERSFTIIAFPIPAIGENFEKIFDEIIEINTLDYNKYRDIQQKIIDALDTADCVRVEGTNGNETSLTINLWKLKNPSNETIFENCLADVNIPVGEVFTSPVLEGTNGLLHVKNVYLNGLPYKNLKLTLKDGMIADYSCDNYEDEAKNKEYIKEHLLFQHDSLAIGEFAIGTNTRAYVVTRKYGLESIMPILIAEKTGPHFAMGDTCYSHEEDMITYNPDGKAIVARENSVSALRNEDPLKAYYGCHTDITIPYDELGALYGQCNDGSFIYIIKDGRFVLEGTKELNLAFDEI